MEEDFRSEGLWKADAEFKRLLDLAKHGVETAIGHGEERAIIAMKEICNEKSG